MVIETDYIPDVEPSKTAVMPDTGDATDDPQTIKALGNLWSRNFPDPLVFSDAVIQFNKVLKFGWKIIDGICTGTCPPAQTMVPDLHRTIKDVETLRNGFKALVDNGAGSASWPSSDPRYQKAKTVGLKVFYEADKTINRWADKTVDLSEIEVDPRKHYKKAKEDWGFWKGALAITLGIVTIATFSDLVKAVKGRD